MIYDHDTKSQFTQRQRGGARSYRSGAWPNIQELSKAEIGNSGLCQTQMTLPRDTFDQRADEKSTCMRVCWYAGSRPKASTGDHKMQGKCVQAADVRDKQTDPYQMYGNDRVDMHCSAMTKCQAIQAVHS